MEQNTPCDKHAEQIKTLFGYCQENKKLSEVVYSLDKNVAVLTQVIKEISEHNKRQDARMDEIQQINVKINENLTELAESQRELNKRVGKLEIKVEENEEKNKIDLRDIYKKKYSEILFKYILPGSGAIIIFLKVLEILK